MTSGETSVSALSLVGLSGNISSPSKTRALVRTALDLVEHRLDSHSRLLEIEDFGPGLGQARRLPDLAEDAQAKIAQIAAADALIVATPIYKGSYPGLFKHLIDLLDPAVLLHKPVLIAATGGGERHALAVEHQLRRHCQVVLSAALRRIPGRHATSSSVMSVHRLNASALAWR